MLLQFFFLKGALASMNRLHFVLSSFGRLRNGWRPLQTPGPGLRGCAVEGGLRQHVLFRDGEGEHAVLSRNSGLVLLRGSRLHLGSDPVLRRALKAKAPEAQHLPQPMSLHSLVGRVEAALLEGADGVRGRAQEVAGGCGPPGRRFTPATRAGHAAALSLDVPVQVV